MSAPFFLRDMLGFSGGVCLKFLPCIEKQQNSGTVGFFGRSFSKYIGKKNTSRPTKFIRFIYYFQFICFAKVLSGFTCHMLSLKPTNRYNSFSLTIETPAVSSTFHKVPSVSMLSGMLRQRLLGGATLKELWHKGNEVILKT